MSAPRIPKKAPESIIPSSPMFTTPLRSEKMPPIAAKASGVAYRSIAAVSADQTITWSRWPSLERVARRPSPIPRTLITIANQASRRALPRISTLMPQVIPNNPITGGIHSVRTLSGGSATQNAISPKAMPIHASTRSLLGRRALLTQRIILPVPPRLAAAFAASGGRTARE